MDRRCEIIDDVLKLIWTGRSEEADALLGEVGYKVRYSDAVLNYCVPSPSRDLSLSVACPIAVGYDRVLPNVLLQRLQHFLRPSSRFWWHHRYFSQPTAYFSHVHDLSHSDNTLPEQLAAVLKFFLIEQLSRAGVSDEMRSVGEQLKQCRKVEWWAHSRAHGRSHQMHWDTDHEGTAGLNNPVCSVVIMLGTSSYMKKDSTCPTCLRSSSPSTYATCGGPTLITQQLPLHQTMARSGWLAMPPSDPSQEGRILCFKGNVLHGVVAGHPNTAPPPCVNQNQSEKNQKLFSRQDFPESDGVVEDNDYFSAECRCDVCGGMEMRRTTFMMAFWKDVRMRPSLTQQPGSCRPFPVKAQWAQEAQAVEEMTTQQLLQLMQQQQQQAKPVQLQYVEPVFQIVDRKTTNGDDIPIPDYEDVFQGC